MVRTLLILAFVAAALGAGAAQPLDTPISIPKGKIPHDCVLGVSKHLSKEDDYAFSLAASAILDSFRDSLPRGLSDEEEMAALRLVFEGLTPRQVILIGWPMRVLRMKASVAGTPHERDEVAPEIETALMMIRKYGKEANQ
jgi:hypothetical protein